MKKIAIALVALLVTCFSVNAQPAFNWQRMGDTSYISAFQKMLVDEYGNVYEAGIILLPDFDNNVLIIKYDQFGNIMWQQIDTGFIGNINVTDMCFGDGDCFYTCGSVKTLNSGTDGYLAKYDESGNLLWRKYYNGITDSVCGLASLTFFNSNVYARGVVTDFQLNQKILLLKYDTLGNLLWARTDTLNNPEKDGCIYMTHDSQNILLTGYTSWLNQWQYRMFIIKYDQSGNKIWQIIDNYTMQGHRGKKIAVDSNDNIYVIMDGFLYNVAKYNNSGNFEWGFKAHPSEINASASFNEIKIDDAQNVYLSGLARIPGGIDGVQSFLFTKLKPDGNEVFNYVGQESGRAGSFDFLTQNDIVIAGSLDTAGNRVIDFDSSGNITWNHIYNTDVPYADCSTVIIDSMKNILLGGIFHLYLLEAKQALQSIKYGNNLFSNISAWEIETGSLSVYPNPANNEISFITEGQKVEKVFIFNMNGALICSSYFPSNNLLEISGIAEGVYIAVVYIHGKAYKTMWVKI